MTYVQWINILPQNYFLSEEMIKAEIFQNIKLKKIIRGDRCDKQLMIVLFATKLERQFKKCRR